MWFLFCYVSSQFLFHNTLLLIFVLPSWVTFSTFCNDQFLLVRRHSNWNIKFLFVLHDCLIPFMIQVLFWVLTVPLLLLTNIFGNTFSEMPENSFMKILHLSLTSSTLFTLLQFIWWSLCLKSSRESSLIILIDLQRGARSCRVRSCPFWCDRLLKTAVTLKLRNLLISIKILSVKIISLPLSLSAVKNIQLSSCHTTTILNYCTDI